MVVTSKLELFFQNVHDMHAFHKKRQCFKRWNLKRKIYNACYLSSDVFKSKALALTMMRIRRYNLMKKRFFFVWREEIRHELRLMWASKVHSKRKTREHFFAWKDCSTQLQLKRKEKEHKRWAMTAIRGIHSSTQKVNEVKKKVEQTRNNTYVQAKKVMLARAKIVSEFDEGVLRQQNDARLKRYEQEKQKMITDWDEKWESIEVTRVDKVIKEARRWINTMQGQNDVLKKLKRIEMKLKSPPPILSECSMIALALLDGKLAERGILAEKFLTKLRQHTDTEGMIAQNSFSCVLEKSDIQMAPSLIRDIFAEVEFKDKTKRKILLSRIEERLKSTYEHFGVEGCRFKTYISQCHGMIVFHDTHTDKVR